MLDLPLGFPSLAPEPTPSSSTPQEPLVLRIRDTEGPGSHGDTAAIEDSIISGVSVISARTKV